MKKCIFAVCLVLIFLMQSIVFANEEKMVVINDLGDYKIIADKVRVPWGSVIYRTCNYGVTDRDGKIVVPQVYDSIYPPTEERAAFINSEGIGFFDENWQIVIEPKFVSGVYPIDGIVKFSDGLCAVGKKSDTEYGYPYKYGYIDRDGNEVINFIYDVVYPFEDGLAEVGIDEYVYNLNTKTKYGKIDKNGNVVSSFKFSYAANSGRGDYEYYTYLVEDKLDVLMSVNLVDINGRRYKNSDIEYPFINHSGISYIPLTYYGCRMMGINCDWTLENGVVLSSGGEVSEDIVGYNGMHDGVYQKAELYKGRLTINEKVYEYGDTPYPLISFKNIVYMPVLWQTGMEALGIEYSFLGAEQIPDSLDGCMVFEIN